MRDMEFLSSACINAVSEKVEILRHACDEIYMYQAHVLLGSLGTRLYSNSHPRITFEQDDLENGGTLTNRHSGCMSCSEYSGGNRKARVVKLRCSVVVFVIQLPSS